VGWPKPSTRPDRRGLETGGRDLSRRTGLGRVMTNSFVRAAGSIPELRFTRLAYRKRPDPSHSG